MLVALGDLVAAVPELIHLWRFLCGAAYAVIEYERLAQIPAGIRAEDDYVHETMALLRTLPIGGVLPAAWLRGFYYNAAVMRADASWERSLKALLNDHSKNDGPALYRRARNDLPSLFSAPYRDSSFAKVRHEVNALKHRLGGVPPLNREQPEVVISALQELFGLLTNQQALSCLRNLYFGKGVPI